MDKFKESYTSAANRNPSPQTPTKLARVVARASVDSELEAMTPSEREEYLKEFDEAERTDEPKKGSLIEKLIARDNKQTEDQIAEESRAKTTGGKDGVIR